MTRPHTLENRHASGWHIIGLVAICLLAWLTSSGLWDLWGNDEGRYVQIGRELLGRRNWLHLTLFGSNYDQKPPLAFWMFAGMLKLNGGVVSEWLVRLPSVLFATLTVVLTYLIGARCYGRRVGLLAGIMLASSPLFFENAPAAELNMIFTGWITLAVAAWLTRPGAVTPLSWPRALVFWGALAGAFLTKGPLAFFVVAAAVLGGLHYRSPVQGTMRRTRPLWSMLRASVGLSALVAVVVGWLMAEKMIAGTSHVSSQLKSELYERIFQGTHSEAPWFYLRRLVSAFFPWAIVVLAVLLLPLAKGWARPWRPIQFVMRSRALPRSRSITWWWLIPLIFLCIVPSKRMAYLLPIFPALALDGARLLTYAIRRRAPLSARAWRLLLTAAGVVITALVIAGLAGKTTLPILLSVLVLAPGALLVYRWRPGGTALLVALGVLVIGLLWLNLAVLRPRQNQALTSKPFAERINALVDQVHSSGREVAAFDEAAEPQYHVYGNYVLRVTNGGQRGLRMKGPKGRYIPMSNLPDVVVLRVSDLPRFGSYVSGKGWTKAFEMSVDERALQVYVRTQQPI